MKEHNTSTAIPVHMLKTEALVGMSACFEQFCLVAGIEALGEMMEQDAAAACGKRHERGPRNATATAGAGPGARSASTEARLILSAPGCAAWMAASTCCRAGKALGLRIGWGNGR